MLLPTWCQEFQVNYDSRTEDMCNVTVHYANRWAVLCVGPSWLDQPEAERESGLLHELVHVGLEPLSGAAANLIENTLEDGSPAYTLAKQQVHDGTEAAVEDLCRAIRRAVNGTHEEPE